MKRLQRRGRKGAAAVLLLLSAGLLGGCQAKEIQAPQLEEPVSISVDTIEVKREDIYQWVSCEAQVVPVTSEVTAEHSGLLGEIFVKEGDQVEEGDLLARLSDEAVKEQLSLQQAAIAAKQEENRLRNEIAECDLELLRLSGGRFEIEEAELRLRQQKETQDLELKRLREREAALQEQIVECDIRAQSAGHIAYVAPLEPGRMLQEGRTLMVLASEELQIRTEFLSDGVLAGYDSCCILYGGEEIPVEPLPYDRSEYIAAILRNGSFYSYFRLTEKEGVAEGIKAGDYAQLQVIQNRREQVCVIPVTCLYRDGSGYYVYRIESGSRVKTPVAAGVRNELMVEITEGLTEGDEVYVRN